MEADFAVELGADDATLDFPWQDPDGSCHYFDLKKFPDLVAQLPEVRQAPEIGEFLRLVNGAGGAFESAKCDVWETPEMSVEDEVFDASVKFGSYVDLLFRDDRRFSFEACEGWARNFVVAAKRAPQAHASTELLIRRCFFPERSGFYFTLYLFGFADDASTARQRWAEALKHLQNALHAI